MSYQNGRKGEGGLGEGIVADYFRVNCLFTSRIQSPAIRGSFNDAQ
jgi:hypothetical protein